MKIQDITQQRLNPVIPSFEEVVDHKMIAALDREWSKRYHARHAYMGVNSIHSWVDDRMTRDMFARADDKTFANTDVQSGFMEWLRIRYLEVVDKLRPLMEQPEIRVWRVIRVPPAWFHNPRSDLGVYWTYDIAGWDEEVGLHSIWGSKRPGQDIVIEADVLWNGVDWIKTIRAHIDYLSGDREFEIRVKPMAPLRVISIRDLDTFFDRDEPSHPIPSVRFTA